MTDDRQFVAFTGQGWRLGEEIPIVVPEEMPDNAHDSQVPDDDDDDNMPLVSQEKAEELRRLQQMKNHKEAMDDWLILGAAWAQQSTLEPAWQDRLEGWLVNGAMLSSRFALVPSSTSHAQDMTPEEFDDWFKEAVKLQGVMNRVYQFGAEVKKAHKLCDEDEPESSQQRSCTQEQKRGVAHSSGDAGTGVVFVDDSQVPDDDDSLDESTLFSPTKKCRRVNQKSACPARFTE